MLVKIKKTGSLGKNVLVQILMMSFFALLAVSCSSSVEQTKPFQPNRPQSTFHSPSSDPTTELTPTPTPARWTTTPTTTLRASSTSRPPKPTAIPDDLTPADLTAVNETREAHERALLLTPSPTPTHVAPLTDAGPWLLGRTEQDLVLLNIDGTGLTHITIDPDTLAFPRNLQGTISSSGNWIAVKIGNQPESQGPIPPDNLTIQLIQLPSEKISRNIPLLSSELSLLIRQDASWYTHDFIFPILNSPLLWSPNGRYLAFSAALDGPSSDLYVYDTKRDRVNRLSDGPNQAWVMSWSPDSKWIIHAESTFILFDHGSTKGQPITKAVWAAAPDGSMIRKVYDADLDIHQIQGWLSPTTFVEQMLRYRPPYRYNIHSVDILSGSSTPLYPCFGSVNYISTSGDVIFWSEGYIEDWADTETLREACSDPFPRGRHVLKDGNFISIPDEISGTNWNPLLNGYMYPTSEGVELRDINGQPIMDFPGERCVPTVSEDGQWLVFISPCNRDYEESRRVTIYNSEGEFQIKTIVNVDKLYWNPDSSGLFLLAGTQLTYFSLLDGATYVLHPDVGSSWLMVVGQ